MLLLHPIKHHCRVSEVRIDRWMEDRHLTDLLNLEERIQPPSLELRHTESLAKVSTILEEVDEAPVHVNEHPNYSTLYKLLPLDHCFVVESLGGHGFRVVVFSPPLVREDVASVQV